MEQQMFISDSLNEQALGKTVEVVTEDMTVTPNAGTAEALPMLLKLTGRFSL